ncbi:hypothetical protein [Microbacterium sp.]|uniref:hypothetical protein n=1 Tax=Microbacterium sp. TaxID=51671 RepID=UPI003340A7C1
MSTSKPEVVRGLLITPGDTVATLRLIAVGAPVGISGVLDGAMIQALDLDGESVLWIDESGKSKGLATNLLATKIAHRLHAGLYPDDTINGPALILGESVAPSGELTSVDLTAATLEALRMVGVEVLE